MESQVKFRGETAERILGDVKIWLSIISFDFHHRYISNHASLHDHWQWEDLVNSEELLKINQVVTKISEFPSSRCNLYVAPDEQRTFAAASRNYSRDLNEMVFIFQRNEGGVSMVRVVCRHDVASDIPKGDPAARLRGACQTALLEKIDRSR